jgi:transcriptional regulator with XRE-family HTH domain
MIDNYKIGNRISLLRREKGLTGESFAEKLGVSPQAVSKWENGKNLPETALLPAIAALLGTSIDSILIPQELVILDARYTCGDSYIVVTDTVNRAVESNKLRFKAECPIGGHNVEGPAVFVLTVKYQTPSGTYYTFVPQGEILELDLSSDGLTAKKGFEIVGAYYGIGGKYRPVMDKIRHYEYFNWNEIHVNHETFPSSPGADESEYLTLVYTNDAGIHVISCEENGVLRYTDDRTGLFFKDASSCILPGIMVLEWERPNYIPENLMPCTWAGALYAALKFMGDSYTYEQIMGMSGACYRITFCEVWDWSALDALVAYPYCDPLFEAIGYEHTWASRLEKDERLTERRKIVSDILHGKPVLAINLRVAAEWGVITGYSDNGKTLYCRTYFDADKLNENKDYLETDNWPFLITHFGDKKEKPSPAANLTASLKTLVESFEAPPRDGYFQGKQGYEKWIEGLRNDSIWDESCPQNDLARRFDVHLSTVYQLADARRCAAVYLSECCSFVGGEIPDMLKEMVDTYNCLIERLNTFKEGLLQKGVSCFTSPKSGKATREEQAALLESALSEELKNVEIAKRIICKNKMTFGHAFCRGELNDAALNRYSVIYSHIPSLLPNLYEINRDEKMVIMADLKKDKDYVPGFHYDEDNDNGAFIRQNYQSILKAAAKWHTAFWENGEAFGQVGLDWRFETKENLLAHISMMEKDFKKYRKNEESGKIPKVWEGEFDGTPFRFENHITPQQLDYFAEAIERLKNEYWELAEARFHTGKNITVIHGDMHPGTANVSKTEEGTVRFDGLQAVRMGLPTEDLAMLVALHIEPDRQKAHPLLDDYYRYLCEGAKDYTREMFTNDYKISIMENMFFTIRHINRKIYDFKMRDKAIRAFESFVLGK